MADGSALNYVRPLHFRSLHSSQGLVRRQNHALILHNRSPKMPLPIVVEVEPPSPLRYIIGALIMMIGVVLPVGYMMFRNKRVPSSSSSPKQTEKF